MLVVYSAGLEAFGFSLKLNSLLFSLINKKFVTNFGQKKSYSETVFSNKPKSGLETLLTLRVKQLDVVKTQSL